MTINKSNISRTTAETCGLNGQCKLSSGNDCAVALSLRNDVRSYVSDEPKMAEYLASIFGTEKDK